MKETVWKFPCGQTRVRLGSLDDVLPPSAGRRCVIVDQRVVQLYPQIFKGIRTLLLPAGEKTKDHETTLKIYREFADLAIGRDDMITIIGGGTITDIGAFCASTWKRGCRFRLVPTTLLGMVDAALGGKTAMNFAGVKNAVGTFALPQETLIAQEFEHTLPYNRLTEGMVEIVKAALIQPGPLFDRLIRGVLLSELIEDAVHIKMNLCVIDPEDHGQRRKLNLGHTFGHVLESLCDMKMTHGQAVATGIWLALRMSLEEGRIDSASFRRMRKILRLFAGKTEVSGFTRDQLLQRGPALLLQDKKRGVHPKLVLFDGFCSVRVVEKQSAEGIIRWMADRLFPAAERG